MKKRHKLALFTASITLGFGVIQAKGAQAATVSGRVDIYGAASLAESVPAVQALYQQSNPNVTFTNTFGASGTLVNQLLGGTNQIDIFFPVSEAPLNTLEAANELVPGTRQDLLTNTLAIITPINSTTSISSVPDLLNVTRQVAIGNPAFVPAGGYAQELFANSGISQQIQPKLVFGSDVRDVLSKVSSDTNDSIDAGVVYTTDALTLAPDKVKIAYTPPTNAYSRIVYASAVLQQSQNPDAARDFNAFLGSPQALSVFQRFGFSAANPTPVPEPFTVGGTIAAGIFGVVMKRKVAAKAKAKAAVD